jgi:hypothetical protein
MFNPWERIAEVIAEVIAELTLSEAKGLSLHRQDIA